MTRADEARLLLDSHRRVVTMRETRTIDGADGSPAGVEVIEFTGLLYVSPDVQAQLQAVAAGEDQHDDDDPDDDLDAA
jgi:hypothetical protein